MKNADIKIINFLLYSVHINEFCYSVHIDDLRKRTLTAYLLLCRLSNLILCLQ